MEWDSNDTDYIEKTIVISPKKLFSNKKLIYCLVYITTPYDFKGHNLNDYVFEQYIPNNKDIDDLTAILVDNDFAIYSD